ncbi:ATP-binding protein [Desulfobacula sp.]|uniref:ATP-binding protein n=1 Tax=Desulfobacula sp. TaxID=2593537 RepID=UPI0026189C0C|nr:ATP-binding protein [Desulfobacula sp.]
MAEKPTYEELEKRIRKLEQAESELKQAKGALKEAHQYTRGLIEASLDALVTISTKGKITDVNKATEVITGMSGKEIIGTDFSNYFIVPDAARKGYQQVFRDGYVRDYPLEIKHCDGRVIPVLYNASVYKDSQGNVAGVFAAARDITERKQAEEKRGKLEAQLQRAHKMEAIGTLAGGVAHDLNNVLGGIVSYPGLLLLEIPEESPFRKPLLIIQESGQKAAAIVQDLLTLAKRGVVVTEVINLNQIVTGYLNSLEYKKLKNNNPGAKIESDLEMNLLNVMGSPVHLSKTVMNLVNNALEAMPEGGNLFISTQNRYIDKPIRGYDDVKEGNYVVLSVSDSGIGISSLDLERIFEPFYTKKIMGRSGTGLGMAVVWGTIKDHKGYIDVQSTPNKGTTFILYFPVTRKEIIEKEKALPMEEYKGKGDTILIVDDVKEQRDVAFRILKELGYSATSVSSGEEAVDYMKDNSADLLILDMIMDPGIDGLETYKKILELHPGQKAIIASGFSETDRVKETQRLGAGKYIKKPYTMEKIGIAVKEELDIKEACK